MPSPRVLLLCPPPCDPAQPYSSLPTLAAFLRARGCEVETADLNIEGVHYLMSPDHLKRCRAGLTSSLTAVAAAEQLDAQSADRYLRAIAASTFDTDGELSIEASVHRLQDSATYQSMAK